MAANAKCIIFGDFSAYAIRQVKDVSILRFDNFINVRKRQATFASFSRADGKMLIPQAIKYLQNSAT